MPELSDDSKSFERQQTSQSRSSKISNEAKKTAPKDIKAQVEVKKTQETKNPVEIDFFDEKLEKAHKEINKIAGDPEIEYGEYDEESEEEEVEILSQ